MKKVLLMIIMVVGVLVNSSPGEAVAKADDTDFYNDSIAYHSPATNKPTASGTSRSEQSAREEVVDKPQPKSTPEDSKDIESTPQKPAPRDDSDKESQLANRDDPPPARRFARQYTPADYSSNWTDEDDARLIDEWISYCGRKYVTIGIVVGFAIAFFLLIPIRIIKNIWKKKKNR